LSEMSLSPTGMETPSTSENGWQNGLTVPTHIAIIMDGNGRWAKRRGLPRIEGHRSGTRNVRRVLEALELYGVSYVTLFAFSTENWSRPTDEVRGLMALLQDTIEREAPTLMEKNVRLRCIGRMDRLPKQLRDVMRETLDMTQKNTGLTLSVALDYGGRDEIVQAVKRIVDDEVAAEDVSAELLQQYLYTRDLPDPDLIIRTAGEQRLSNFLIWQSIYSEYHFSPVDWPDFDEDALEVAIQDFSQRKRRFGRVAADL